MKWLKDVYLDLVVLLLIALFAVYTSSVFEIILWVYTALLLLSKVLTFVMPSLQKKANKTSAPPFFYHVIYALTVAIFLYITKYYLAGAWLVIWILSIVSFAKTKKN